MQHFGGRGAFGQSAGMGPRTTVNAVRLRISVVPSVGSRAIASGMVLTVSDDGPGIPEDAAAALLQRGMRLDEATPGHGIGLAVVKDIAKSYGGSLAIGTSELGGAEFMVSIPPVSTARSD